MAKKIPSIKAGLPNGIYSLLEKLSVPAFGLFTFFIIIRGVDQESFGYWVIFVSLTALIESVLNAFTITPFIRFIHNCKPAQQGLFYFTSLVLNTALATFFVINLLIFRDEISSLLNTPRLSNLLELYCFNLILIVPFVQLNALQYAYSKFQHSFFAVFSRRFAFFLYVGIVFFSSSAIVLERLVIAQIAATLVGLCVSFAVTRKYLKFKLQLDTVWMRKLFHYAKYTVGNNLTSIVAKSIDTWMLGALLSPLAVAIYNPAIKISNLIEVPTGALSSYAYPKFALLSSQHQLSVLQKKVELIIGFNLAIFLPMLAIIYLFAEKIIILIAGAAYSESVPILYITLLHALIIPFERHLGVAFNALGKANYNLWLSLGRAVLNVVLNYILISQYGVAGAAIATLITYVIGATISFTLMQRVVPLSLAHVFGSTFKFFLSPLQTARSV